MPQFIGGVAFGAAFVAGVWAVTAFNNFCENID